MTDVLEPLLVRLIEGRSGSTALMHLLSTSSLVYLNRGYPYEQQYCSYLVKLLAPLSPSFPKTSARDMRALIEGESSQIGPIPFYLSGVDPTALYLRTLHGAWRSFSESVAMPDNAKPRYCAEKFWGLSTRHLVEANLPIHVIHLLRDPRDIAVSVRAFDQKRGFFGFGRFPTEDWNSYLLRLMESMKKQFAFMQEDYDLGVDCKVVQYGDLATNLPFVANQLSRWLSINLETEGLTQTDWYAQHVTTAQPVDSVGKWRTALSRRDIEAIEESLAPQLLAFGFTDTMPGQHTHHVSQRLDESQRQAARRNTAGTAPSARAVSQLDERLKALESVLREFQNTNETHAETRHASIWQLLRDQHRDIESLVTHKTEDIAHLIRRLRLLISERPDSMQRLLTNDIAESAGVTSESLFSVAAKVRDFLGAATDEDPPAVRRQVGSVEVELPAWDKVIAPWLEEYKEWEPAVTQTLAQLVKPGFTVVDVGAHVGIFTLLASRLVGEGGRVIALEPDPVNARFLRRNVMGAHCTNVLVLEVAAADGSQMLPLCSPSDDNTGDSRTYKVATTAELRFVNAFALDDLLPAHGRVDLVKFDLQGMDHVALRGMRQIMAQQHPRIIIAFWPQGIRAYGDNPSDVIRSLRNLGDYSWTALELPNLTNAHSDDELCAAVEDLPDGYVNLLLRPTNKNGLEMVSNKEHDQ